MDWLYRISIVCFAASYLLVFGLEISRVFLQAPLRRLLMLGLALAGLFAHTVYLILQTELQFNPRGIWFGSWSGWCLAGAWFLMWAYIWISFRHRETLLGVFLLPVVLALTAIGGWFESQASFTLDEAQSVWGMIHGASLLLGTISVALGFVSGLAYLLLAHRLKHKRPPWRTFRLPSLEWLQQGNERALLVSVSLLGLGLVSGVMLNLFSGPAAGAGPRIAWIDPVVLTSGLLFLWLLATAIFGLVYRPARQGRKVAYLVIACFLFLVLELGMVWYQQHGQPDPGSAGARTSSHVAQSSGGQP